MREHAFVTFFKLGLLAFLAVILTINFVGENETQSKVIATAEAVDALKDQVADVKRTLGQGTSETQSKVTRTAEAVDALRDDVADVKRSLAQGVVTLAAPSASGGQPTAPSASGGRPAARLAPPQGTPGWTPLLSEEPEPPRPPDDQIDWDAQLRYPLPLEPKGFNLYTSDRDAYVANEFGHNIHGPLAERKNSDKDDWKPGLAEYAERSPDRTEYRVYLRPGVKWHRPSVDLTDPKYEWMRGEHEVTAEDLEFTLRMILDKRADTDNIRPGFEDVVEYRAEGKYVFRVKWKEPNFYATGILLSDLVPLAKWIFTREEDGSFIDDASLAQRFANHWFNKRMCGYGAYVFREYKKSDYVLLERNEDWWGRRPAFKTILFRLNVSADEQRYNMFFAMDGQGRRDADVYAMAPVRWKQKILEGADDSPLLDSSKVYVHGYQRMMYAYNAWACRHRFFQDKRVRQAMTLAANRDAWMKDILHDIAICPTGIAYTESPEYDRSVPAWPYDLEEAKRLLEAAGWVDADGNGVREKTIGGEVLEMRIKMLDQASPNPEIDAMRSDWFQSLKRIGVIITGDPVEWSEFQKRIQDREFECVGGAWRLGDEFQPDTLFHSRLIDIPGSHNYGEWSHPRADEIMDALKTTFDLKKRYALCHELHRIFREEQPYTIMWSWRNPIAHDARLGGVHARNFNPQVDLRATWWQKGGNAKYEDGRDRGKGLRRKSGG